MTRATRWRPRRAGIINLYEYSDQVFDFAGGRLLLRGHNTSGKTKALELLLPFCLDGDTRPTKLDPFASGAKEMKWNLVGSYDGEKRTGYVWIEFERLDDSGAAQRLTAGIGLRAHRDLPGVTRWHFIARNRTVGADLVLLRGREPIAKAELVAALGDDGEVLDGQREYRERLRELLFGFGSEEQFQTMLRLMLDLRRPHLSKTLNPDGVADQLTAGLPAVDELLMRRLAGGLEQLETLERSLERLRDVRERVRRFHQRTYSAYARAIVRERGEALRQAQSAVDRASEQLRGASAALDQEGKAAARWSAERDDAEAAVARLSAEEHALISSAAWSSIAEVAALGELAVAQRRAAGSARERADSAAVDATELEARLITARAVAGDQREQADADLSAALDLAAQAGLVQRVERVAEQLRAGTLGPEAWGTTIRELSTDWRDVLHRHRDLMGALHRASATAERARADERECAIRLEQAVARRAVCEEQLDQAREAFTSEFTGWRAVLVELQLDEDDTESALELAHAGKSPAPALAVRAERARTVLADARSSHAGRRRTAIEATAATEAEIERLASARDDGPPAPAWARAEREGRAGAPLWRLIDFRRELGADHRAALEAALEAMGLLDAWVTPSGALDDPALADVVLMGGQLRATEGSAGDQATLAEVLTPVARQPVAETVVMSLLHRIGLGERSGGPWADLDGRFVLGPLAGRGAKQAAQHIGAAAREARRATQIAELRSRIADLTAEIAAHEAALEHVDRRRAALEAELASLPEVDAVASADDAARVSLLLEAEAARAHESASRAARAAADAEIAADAARREHAVAHALPVGLDESGLERLREAGAELAGTATTVARSWALAAREFQAVVTLVGQLAQAQRGSEEHHRRARDEEAEAERLTAEHAAREQTLGATGEELRIRHETVVGDLRVRRDAYRRAGDKAQQALIAAAALERDHAARATEHDGARAQRESASATFAQVAHTGILQLVLGEAAPEDAQRSRTWTLSRTLEVARALPEQLLAVRSPSGAQAVEVQRAVQLLDRELAEADMGAYASRGEDGLLLVRVTEGGGEQTLPELLDTLRAEIADREQILTEEERRVFNDALVEEIADHLRQRIHEVRGRVEQMNAVLLRSPTAAGKTVELDWQPLDDDAGVQRTALALLRRGARNLSGEPRDELVAFFRRRVETARREHAFGEQPRPMAETLMSAFDYRRWFGFGLHERSDAGRIRLTKRRHATGSGGEQSVLIHLPLFAAAAALYGNTNAPRLIMLDEALSGIDDETRERVLAATVAFDLDVVMTSHELWGTYRSVPQLSVYQLHRENGAFGVHAIPFLWDGDVLRELEQRELLV